MSIKKDKVQGMNLNQLKHEVHDTYKKDEKITTSFEPSNGEDVINKAFLDENLLELNGYLSLLEKIYNEYTLNYNKQPVEILVQRVVKTTVQILYDKGLFDAFANADKVLKDFLFATRRRPDLEKANNDVLH